MTLRLPPGTIPAFVPINDDNVLRGDNARYTYFRIDLLDDDEHLIDVLDGVQPGGSLEWSAAASIKGSGSITVTDVGQLVRMHENDPAPIDWLNVRLRPVLILEGFSVPEWPLSIWLTAAPSEQWTDLGRTWEVELLDKSSILDQDIYADPDSGQVTSFSAPAGANVITIVRSLIEGTGESAAAISDDPTTLTSPLTWETGTTRLKIINDLLNAGNFFSLFVDHFGQFQAVKYHPPSERPIMYEALGPFIADTSVMAPDWTKDADIYSVPNRVVAIGATDGDTPALMSVAENHDPTSPFSYENRGERWITRVETEVEATGQESLDGYVQRLLITSTAVAAKFSIQHLVLPDLTINSVVRVMNPDANVDTLCTVSNTTIPLDPLALANSTLSEAAGETGPPSEDTGDMSGDTSDVTDPAVTV